MSNVMGLMLLPLNLFSDRSVKVFTYECESVASPPEGNKDCMKADVLTAKKITLDLVDSK